MTQHRWRGVLTLEDVQTGDGRVFAPNSIEWANLPLPLAWLAEGDQHVGLSEVAPVVGVIETIAREGNEIVGEGFIDDATEEGAQVVRMMTEGAAPLGSQFPVSIDGDNWEVQIIISNELADEIEEDDDFAAGHTVMLSGTGRFTLDALRVAIRAALTAAAGDPDPGEDGGADGEVLFEDNVDSILERYTRLRIRGATLCAVAAFDGALIELVTDGATAEPPTDEAVAAALPVPVRPPSEWFTMPYPQPGDERLVQQIDGSWAVPLTITDDGQVFGHLARRDQGHRGYSQRVMPPTSRTGYAEFHTGHVVCADDTDVATGALVVGADHAPLSMRASEARDFYANSALGWADVRCYDGEFGPFVCGALRPTVTEEDLRVLRALSLSGDWRASDGHLELVSALAVNVPGFPIARESMAASALCVGGVCLAPPTPALGIEDGEVVSLVAAGIVSRCSECAEREREAALVAAVETRFLNGFGEIIRVLHTLERRTKHLEPSALSAAAERLHANSH